MKNFFKDYMTKTVIKAQNYRDNGNIYVGAWAHTYALHVPLLLKEIEILESKLAESKTEENSSEDLLQEYNEMAAIADEILDKDRIIL